VVVVELVVEVVVVVDVVVELVVVVDVVVVDVVVVDVVVVEVVVDSLCGAATSGVVSSRLKTTAPADAPPIASTSPAPTSVLRVMKRMDPSGSCDLVHRGIGASGGFLE